MSGGSRDPSIQVVTPADSGPSDPSQESEEKGWYRYGDSNPGPVAENHVS